MTDEEAQSIFMKTGLDESSLGQVWDLVNPEGLEEFDFKMFAMAMHFLQKHKKGVPLPHGIPVEMVASFGGGQ